MKNICKILSESPHILERETMTNTRPDLFPKALPKTLLAPRDVAVLLTGWWNLLFHFHIQSSANHIENLTVCSHLTRTKKVRQKTGFINAGEVYGTA